MNQQKTNSYVDRINKLLASPTIAPEDKLSLQIGLERLAERLSLTPTCLRIMAKLENTIVVRATPEQLDKVLTKTPRTLMVR